jgi:hypothetical protein
MTVARQARDVFVDEVPARCSARDPGDNRRFAIGPVRTETRAARPP